MVTYDLSQTRAADSKSIRFGSKLEAREVGEIIVLLNMSLDGVWEGLAGLPGVDGLPANIMVVRFFGDTFTANSGENSYTSPLTDPLKSPYISDYLLRTFS